MEDQIENKTDEVLNNTIFLKLQETELSYDFEKLKKWFLGFYFGIIFLGVCFNMFLIVCILRQKKNGKLYCLYSSFVNEKIL